jgi:hypothetical protein
MNKQQRQVLPMGKRWFEGYGVFMWPGMLRAEGPGATEVQIDRGQNGKWYARIVQAGSMKKIADAPGFFGEPDQAVAWAKIKLVQLGKADQSML